MVEQELLYVTSKSGNSCLHSLYYVPSNNLQRCLKDTTTDPGILTATGAIAAEKDW